MLKIYTIYDSKAEAYLQPMFFPNAAVCLRTVAEMCNNPESNLCKYAEDYTLFELATWDEDTGTILPHETKTSLGMAIEFKSYGEKQ